MADHPTPDERRFRALASSSVEHVAEIDERGRVLYATPDARPGYGAASLGFDRILREDRPGVARTLAEVFRTGDSRRASFRVRDAEGETLWLEVTMTPFTAENDERHALIVSRDVTGARKLEQSLRDSRERFRRVAENAYDMITEYDASGAMLYCNDRVWKVLGYEEGEKGRRWGELVHPEDRARLFAAFRRVRDGGSDALQVVYRVRRADDSWCWIEASVFATETPGSPRHTLIIARDVTERIEAERRLRESERRYRELIEKAPVGIVVVQDERIVYANAAAAVMCGAGSAEDLAGIALIELIPSEAMQEVTDAVTRAERGERASDAFDVRIVGLDGRPRHLLGVGTIARWARRPAFQAIMRDVTELEQSRLEQARLTLQLQESRKLESLGVLAGGIAHDFNNLLAVILSNVRYAKTAAATPTDRAEALCDAETATESAARLVRQLLDYAGRRKPEVRSVDVSDLTRSMADLLSTALSSAVTLRLEIDPEPLPVHADVVQLEQVLMNLVLNAADAVGESPGTVTVRTCLRHLSEEALSGWLGGELGPGAYACLEVEDSGAGMDEATRARIFEPFFTTKQEGHGLGLSAVLGLVQGHRGAIEVVSEPGRGTRFCVALPANPTPARSLPARATRSLVLVADPDRGRRQATCLVIREAGCDVLEAGDDAQAMDLWSRHGDELDAAVVDARTSASGGRRVARMFLSRRPGLPVLVLLGSEGVLDAREATPDAATLQAPFTASELRARLAELLAKRDAHA